MTGEQARGLQASADMLGCDIIAEADGKVAGRFLPAMLGGGPRREGPPYEQRHVLPDTDEAMAAAPFLPSLTVERGRAPLG